MYSYKNFLYSKTILFNFFSFLTLKRVKLLHKGECTPEEEKILKATDGQTKTTSTVSVTNTKKPSTTKVDYFLYDIKQKNILDL